jgi:excisionase family DNA binding protein
MIPSLLTVKEMAIRLQVKDKTIYAWATQGKIPCVKVNGVIRFDAREIDLWLQACHMPIGPARIATKHRSKGPVTSVDSLIESAKREVYSNRGETRAVASPHGKERTNGAR